MGSNTLLQKKGNLYKDKTQNIEYRIAGATCLKDYYLQVTRIDGTGRHLNFTPALLKYAKGYYGKYLQMPCFKSFATINENIVWGAVRDFIFDAEKIYSGQIKTNP